MVHRRTLLRGTGVATFAGLAGCLGGLGGGADEDESWPPNTLELITSTSPGGGIDAHNTGAEPILQGLYPDETTVNHGVYPGADQLIAANRVANSEPGDPRMGMLTESNIIVGAILNPEIAEFEPSDWDDSMIKLRRPTLPGCVIVNRHTVGPDENFTMNWEDFVELAPELSVGSGGIDDNLQLRALEYYSDELEMGDINIVSYDGGSDIRAAMLREEVDIYLDSVGAGLVPDRQEEYYTTQLILGAPSVTDDDNVEIIENMVEEAYESEPDIIYGDEPVWLEETSYPSEGAENIAQLASTWGWFLPPDISEDAYQEHAEIIEEFVNLPEWRSYLEDTRGTLTGEWSDCVGDCAREQFAAKREVFEEVLEVIPEEELRQ